MAVPLKAPASHPSGGSNTIFSPQDGFFKPKTNKKPKTLYPWSEPGRHVSVSKPLFPGTRNVSSSLLPEGTAHAEGCCDPGVHRSMRLCVVSPVFLSKGGVGIFFFSIKVYCLHFCLPQPLNCQLLSARPPSCFLLLFAARMILHTATSHLRFLNSEAFFSLHHLTFHQNSTLRFLPLILNFLPWLLRHHTSLIWLRPPSLPPQLPPILRPAIQCPGRVRFSFRRNSFPSIPLFCMYAECL